MTQRTGFIHQVYFWLRDGGTAEDAARLVEGCQAYLTNIPGVVRLLVGEPAGTPRPVVDNTYAVALLVEFADRAGHDAYQTHPDHERFVAECGPLWSRVQIYDALVRDAG